MSESEKPIRKSNITVGINRTLNTAQYENINIKVESTEEIMWTDMAERQKKIDIVTQILINQYKATQSKVLEELNVAEKAAWKK